MAAKESEFDPLLTDILEQERAEKRKESDRSEPRFRRESKPEESEKPPRSKRRTAVIVGSSLLAASILIIGGFALAGGEEAEEPEPAPILKRSFTDHLILMNERQEERERELTQYPELQLKRTVRAGRSKLSIFVDGVFRSFTGLFR